MHIVLADATTLEDTLPALIDLLVNVVDDGASIGFMPPLSRDDAMSWWRERIAAVAASTCYCWLASVHGRVIGSVQLGLVRWPNGQHRADVLKLMVHTAFRRRGIGRALMLTLMETAVAIGRTTLVLDTREDDPSEGLYQRLGFVRVGEIPQFVINPDRTFAATVYYYRLLP